MAMNVTQRKHVLTRLNEIVRKKCNALEVKLSKEAEAKLGKVPNLTVGVLIAGIKDGSIKMNPGTKAKTGIDDWDQIGDIFDLSRWDQDKTNDDIYEIVDVYREKLKAEVDRIEDELILGDVENALAMIKNFEKFANGTK